MALKANLSGYENVKTGDDLYKWFDEEGSSLNDLNELKSPEAYLFIYKVLAKIAIKKKDEATFKLVVGNSERIINFYELIEYSDSLYKLKNSWINI